MMEWTDSEDSGVFVFSPPTTSGPYGKMLADNNAFLLDALARMRNDILETIETINLRFQVLDAKVCRASLSPATVPVF